MKNILCRRSIPLLLLLGVLWATNGCSTVPVSGRKQFNVISPGQEMQLGLASFERMKKETPISRDPAARALVEKVGRRIAAVAAKDLPNAQWEFVVFESKEMNAFCLPGGKIGVYTGILKVTQDEAGLATVLGHEVAHAAAHHGGERMTKVMAIQTTGEILGATLSNSDPRVRAAANVSYGLGTQLLVALPHDRLQEAEADQVGLIYMARAGYDPRRSVEFWQRFERATAGSANQPWFLQTHPVTPDRIKHLQDLMPQAVAEFEQHRENIRE